MLRVRVLFLGYRESPRRRHDLPRVAVFLLRPFFQYSDWRDAWILRIVGERYGPVLRVPASRDRPRVGAGAPTTLLTAGGIAVAAVLGFLIARSGSAGSSTPPLGRPVSAGPLEVAFPQGWQLRPASTLPQLGLLAPIGAVSGSRLIVVGRASTSDPSLLTRAILESIRRRPAAQLVTLGATTFYRYSDLSPRGLSGLESVYAVPTLSGTFLAVCQTRTPDSGFASTCQRVVRSIRNGKTSPSPGLIPAYASTLTQVIDRLNATRARWGAQLSAARTAAVQGRAASQLAAAHEQAAAALPRLPPSSAQAANAELVAALHLEADAYAALARAATHGQPRGYADATAAVANANDALTAAISALRSAGYPVI
jgi:hypothetical protein